MSKNIYTIHDNPIMQPKTIELYMQNANQWKDIIGAYPEVLSAKEYVELEVKKFTEKNGSPEVVEYSFNVKADK